jgi:hypothetical protein
LSQIDVIRLFRFFVTQKKRNRLEIFWTDKKIKWKDRWKWLMILYVSALAFGEITSTWKKKLSKRPRFLIVAFLPKGKERNREININKKCGGAIFRLIQEGRWKVKKSNVRRFGKNRFGKRGVSDSAKLPNCYLMYLPIRPKSIRQLRMK